MSVPLFLYNILQQWQNAVDAIQNALWMFSIGRRAVLGIEGNCDIFGAIRFPMAKLMAETISQKNSDYNNISLKYWRKVSREPIISEVLFSIRLSMASLRLVVSLDDINCKSDKLGTQRPAIEIKEAICRKGERLAELCTKSSRAENWPPLFLH